MIKYQTGKLPLPESPEIYLPKQRERHLISSLPIDEESGAQLAKLPPLQRDPFDRVLMCQSLQHRSVMVTEDPAIMAYPLISILNKTSNTP